METSLSRSSIAHRPNNAEKRGGKITNRPVYSFHPKITLTLPKKGKSHYLRDCSNMAEDYLSESTSVNFYKHSNQHEKINIPSSCSDGYFYAASQMVLLPHSNYESCIHGEEPPGWDELASINVYDTGDLTCPICLSTPSVPRMERCGHVYCWPCIIQFIQYDNDSNSKKCAICSRILTLGDFKSVSLIKTSSICVGNCIKMSLVKRSKYESRVKLVSNESVGVCNSIFQFIYKANQNTLENLKQNELNDLELCRAVSEMDNIELIPYIDYAFAILNSDQTDKSGKDNLYSLKYEKHVSDDVQTNNEYHFYQASNGHHVYLNGLMWRCLLKEYKSQSYLPMELEVTILSLKHQCMTSRLRKRLQYLSHLPDGYSFILIEVELKHLVSESTLLEFADSLTAHQLGRNRCQLEDLKLTQLKEAAENRLLDLPPGFVLSGHAELLGHQDFECNPQDFVALCCNNQQTTSKRRFTTTFADMTRLGALDVIGPNRVANFCRSPPQHQNHAEFNVSGENWPSLNDAFSKDESTTNGQGSSGWKSRTTSFNNSTNTSST